MVVRVCNYLISQKLITSMNIDNTAVTIVTEFSIRLCTYSTILVGKKYFFTFRLSVSFVIKVKVLDWVGS